MRFRRKKRKRYGGPGKRGGFGGEDQDGTIRNLSQAGVRITLTGGDISLAGKVKLNRL